MRLQNGFRLGLKVAVIVFKEINQGSNDTVLCLTLSKDRFCGTETRLEGIFVSLSNRQRTT